MPKLHLPRDGNTFLSFEGDRQTVFKQAGAVLAAYPYQHPEAERQAARLLERYAPKTDPRGPAMSEAIHATLYARIGQSERAYAEWRKAWGEFAANRPLLLFGETRKGGRTYFVTGAAGCLQTVLYGFLGFRIDYTKEPGALWSKRLNGGWLSVKPHLPKAWRSVAVRNLRLLGQTYQLEITRDGVRVTEGE